jgi:hypothetical protein
MPAQAQSAVVCPPPSPAAAIDLQIQKPRTERAAVQPDLLAAAAARRSRSRLHPQRPRSQMQAIEREGRAVKDIRPVKACFITWSPLPCADAAGCRGQSRGGGPAPSTKAVKADRSAPRGATSGCRPGHRLGRLGAALGGAAPVTKTSAPCAASRSAVAMTWGRAASSTPKGQHRELALHDGGGPVQHLGRRIASACRPRGFLELQRHLVRRWQRPARAPAHKASRPATAAAQGATSPAASAFAKASGSAATACAQAVILLPFRQQGQARQHRIRQRSWLPRPRFLGPAMQGDRQWADGLRPSGFLPGW